VAHIITATELLMIFDHKPKARSVWASLLHL